MAHTVRNTATRAAFGTIAVAAGLGMLAAALMWPRLAGAATTNVEIVNFAFAPAATTVQVGDTVTWKNSDTAPHTATGDAAEWDSGTLTTGQTFSFTANQAGTFAYHCTIHPSMVATLVVAPPATAPAGSAPPAAGGAAPQPAGGTPPRQLPATGDGSTQTTDVGSVAIALGIGGAALAAGGAGLVLRSRRSS